MCSVIDVRRQLLAILATLFSCHSVTANPNGPQVVQGQANFSQPDVNTLNITNSPGAIINWQQFSIGQNEITRFIQESAQSAVLNRVVGQDPSSILGQLLSNGRVFLINPNGMVFGENAVINTAGFVASTLNMTDEDFTNQQLKFQGDANAGAIKNLGYIKAGANGDIYLIAPNIENSGIIETEGGNLILAAGQSVTIASLDDDHIVFDVQAPENAVINLGQILTQGGAARIFAGTIQNSGVINADGIKMNAGGKVQLVAQADIEIMPESAITANGPQGGSVEIKSETGTTWISGTIEARGIPPLPSGEGAGGGSGKGGTIHILGERVALLNQAKVNASGENGGGEVLVGGDYQGKNPEIKNAKQTYVGADTLIKADAITQGDGGKAIVWSDDAAWVHGTISARGGAQSGNGGFIETSGHYLDVAGIRVDASASAGQGGTWLLDPFNITVTTADLNITDTDAGANANFQGTANGSTIAAATIVAVLNTGSNVILDTTGGGTDAGDITVNSAIAKSAGANATLTLNAHNNLDINASITSSVGQLNLVLNPDSDNLGGGAINLGTTTLNANGGTISAAGKTVNIAGGTATISSAFDLGTLNLSSGTLTGTGVVTVNNTMNWSGGSMNVGGVGSVNIASGAALNLSGASAKVMNAGNLNNSGTMTWTGAGNLQLNTGSVLTNNALFDIQTDADIAYTVGAVPQLINSATGTLRKSAGTGLTVIGATNAFPFNNNGTIDIQTGTLQLNGATSFSGTSNVTGGLLTLTGGGGTNTGTININSGGSIDFASGTHSFSGTTNLNGTGGLTLSAATWSGTGTVNVNVPALSWTGGSMNVGGVGSVNIASGAALNLSGASAKAMNAGNLNNSGTMTWTGAGNLQLNTGSVLTNNALFDIQTDADIAYTVGAVPQLINSATGTIRKSAGTTTNTVIGATNAFTFANNGTLDAQVGVIQYAGVNAFNSGTVFASTGAGTGINRVTNGGVFNGAISTANLELAGGSYSGTASFTGTANWAAGNFTGGGTLTIPSGSVLNIANAGAVAMNNYALSNAGTVTWTGAGNLQLDTGSVLTNNALFDIQTDADIAYTVGAVPQLINSATGTLRKSAGTGLTVIGATNAFPVTNSGLIEVQTGTLQVNQFASGTNSGIIDVASAATLSTNGAALSNSVGGTIRGSGTINLGSATLTNNGTIAPGAPTGDTTGTLPITGNLLLSPSSILDIELGGTAVAGVDYDLIAVSGSVTFDGTQNILHFSGFTPAVSNTFQVMTYASSTGGFATVNVPVGYSYSTTFNPTNLVLGTLTVPVISCVGTICFDNSSGDFLWTNALNWDTDALPIVTDDVVINFPGGITVILSSGTQSIGSITTSSGNNLTISGGTLDIANASTMNGTLTLSGGTLGGTGNVIIAGAFNATGTSTLAGTGSLTTQGTSTVNMAAVNGSLTLNGKTWINEGALTLGGDEFIVLTNGTLTNAASGTLNLNSSNASPLFWNGGVPIVNNAGILNQTAAGTHNFQPGITFNNTGTVNVDAGTLRIDGGGTDTGLYAVDTGTTLQFNAGTRNLDAGSNITGAGTLTVSGGTVNVNNLLGITATGAALNISGGALNLNSALTVAATTPVNLSGGTLGGTGNVIIAGAFNATGTSTLAGTGSLTTQGTSTVNMAAVNGSLTLNGKTWINEGALTLGGDEFIVLTNGTLTNAASGTLNLNSSNASPLFWNGGVPIVNNAGILNQTAAGTHNFQPGITFNNTGTVNVDAGTLRIDGGGTDTGLYAVDTGTTLQFNAGTRNLDAGSNITGAGTLTVSGGTVNVNNLLGITATGAALNISGGALNLNSALTVAATTPVNLSGGTLGGTGNVIIAGAFNATGTSTLAGTGSLTTQGTSTVNMAAVNGSLTLNGKTWINEGALTLGGDEFIVLTNGTLTNAASGTLNLNSSNASPLFWNGGVPIVNNAGILNQTAAGTHNFQPGITFNNTGTVNVDAGTLRIDGALTQSGTINVDSGTTFQKTGGFTNTSTGILMGNGTIDVGAGNTLTNQGTLRPGASPGTLTITGNLLLSPSSILDIELGGTAVAGVDYDLIAVSGSVTFDGTLNILHFGGFAPAVSNTFQVMTYASSTGTFATVNASVGYTYGTSFNPANLVLTTLTIPTACFGGTICFDNSFGDFLWTNALNWDTNALPIVTDDVVIDLGGGITVILSLGTQSIGSITIASGNTLEISGGTLDIANASTIDGDLALTGGGLTGTGDVTVAGAFNVTGSSTLTGAGNFTTQGTSTVSMAAVNGGLFLNGKTWNNEGVITVGGDDFIALDTSTLTNQASGTLTLNSTTAIPLNSFGSASTLNNAGILNQSAAGTHNTHSAITFNNSGTVNVDAGTLRIDGGGTDTGLYAVDATTTLQFNGGTRNLNAGSNITGLGTLTVSAGTVNVNNLLGITATGAALNVSGGALNLNNPFTVAAATPLTLSGGTLGGTGNLTVAGAFNVTGSSTLTGAGNFTTQGTSTVSMAAVNGGLFLNGKTWNNEGVITVGGDDFIALDTSTLTNQASGTLTLNSTTAIPLNSFGSASTLNNAGILNQSAAGTHNTHSAITFNNSGTVNVDAGTLRIDGGGTDTGLYAVDATTTLQFNGGTRNLNAGSNITGLGTLTVSAGTVNVNNLLGITATGAALNVSGGALNLNNPFTVAAATPLTLSGGTLGGTGNLTVAGAFNVTGSSTLTGAGNFTTQGTSTVSMAAVNGGLFLNGKTWNNEGVITVGGDDFIALDTSTLTNQASGTLTLNSTTAIPLNSFGSASTLNNAGILNQSAAGTHNTHSAITFNNSGTVNVDAGTLRIDGGGTDTGLYAVDATTTLQFNGGTRNLNAGSNITGLGTLTVSAGTVNVNNLLGITATGAALNVSGGALNLNNPFTVAAATPLTLSGGTLGGTGNLTVAGAFNVNGGNMSGAGTLVTAGTTTVSAPVDMTRNWTNQGTLDLTGTGEISLNNGGVTFTNQGTLNLTTSDTTPFNVNGGAPIINADGGIINKNSAGVTDFGNPFSNQSGGTVNVNSGTLTLNSFPTNSGIIDVAAGAAFQKTGGFTNTSTGILMGNGTFDVGAGNTLTNNGTISPGASPGTLTITGNLLLNPSSILDIELGGLTQGVSYDLLNVTGTAALDGALNIILFGGFTGNIGNLFDIMTYASNSGDFSSVNAPTGYTFLNSVFGGFYRLEIPDIFTPPTPPPLPPGSTSTDQVLVLQQNQTNFLNTFAAPSDTQSGDQFLMLVDADGNLLYGYYDANGNAVVVGTDPDATGSNGELLTSIPADESNQPLTQTQVANGEVVYMEEEQQQTPQMCQ